MLIIYLIGGFLAFAMVFMGGLIAGAYLQESVYRGHKVLVCEDDHFPDDRMNSKMQQRLLEYLVENGLLQTSRHEGLKYRDFTFYIKEEE